MPYIFKVCVAGDGASGKSTTIGQYCEGTFKEAYIRTIGANFMTKNFKQGGYDGKMQLWDFAGQEHFRSILSGFLRGSVGLIYVFDLTRPETYSNLKKDWITFCERTTGKVPGVILGNKVDLLEENGSSRRVKLPPEITEERQEKDKKGTITRVVGKEGTEVQSYDSIYKDLINDPVTADIPYFETSAKTGYNIEFSFHLLTAQIISRIAPGELDKIKENLNHIIEKECGSGSGFYDSLLEHWAKKS